MPRQSGWLRVHGEATWFVSARRQRLRAGVSGATQFLGTDSRRRAARQWERSAFVYRRAARSTGPGPRGAQNHLRGSGPISPEASSSRRWFSTFSSQRSLSRGLVQEFVSACTFTAQGSIKMRTQLPSARTHTPAVQVGSWAGVVPGNRCSHPSKSFGGPRIAV